MVASNVDTGPWTVSRLLAWTRDYFARQQVESPRLCAELLLAHAMGCPRIRLYTQHEAVPGPDVLQRYREAVKAAAAGEPIAYLTGVKEFFSLEFEVTPAVLIPRPETEVLVERTCACCGNRPRPWKGRSRRRRAHRRQRRPHWRQRRAHRRRKLRRHRRKLNRRRRAH